VVVDMCECVLFDIGNTDVFVLVNFSLFTFVSTIRGRYEDRGLIYRSRYEFPAQYVDESRFASTVRTDDSNTRSKRDLEGDIADLRLRRARILESHLADTDNSLGLGLDAFEETWFGELELDLRSAELVVRFGRRNFLDEL